MRYAALSTLVLASTALGQRFGDVLEPVLGPSTVTALKEPKLGDVDGDGDLDLVIDRGGGVSRDQSIVELWLGDGTGRFVQAKASDWVVQRDRLTGWNSVLLADFDGDGFLDIMLAGSGPGPAWKLFTGKGRGKFVAAWTKSFSYGQTRAVNTADIDGDGDVDIVPEAFWYTGSQVLRNDGKGNFTLVALPSVNNIFNVRLIPLDIEGDGDIDFIQAWPFRLLVQGPAWVFTEETAQRFGQVARANDVAAGDIEGDGDPDVIILSATAPPTFYRNNGKGVFVADNPSPFRRVGSPTRFLLEDCDNDGDLDALLVDALKPLEYWRNDGANGFVSASSRIYMAPAAFMFTTVDIDTDGDMDVVYRDGNLVAPGPLRLLTNFEHQLYVPTSVNIGSSLVLTAAARPGFASQKLWLLPAVGARLAVLRAIPNVGLLGLDPSSFVPLPLIPTAKVDGISDLHVPVPNLAALRGAEVWLQGTWTDGVGSFWLSNLRRTIIQ